MLTILLAILSSTVISAVVTGVFNNKAKHKELRMNASMKENHNLINNIGTAFMKYTEANNQYSIMLAKCIDGQIKLANLSEYISTLNKYKSELDYYINQTEYQNDYYDIVNLTLNANNSLFNKMWDKAASNSNRIIKGLEIDEVETLKYIDELELKNNEYITQLSNNLALLVKQEKNNMLDDILQDKI